MGIRATVEITEADTILRLLAAAQIQIHIDDESNMLLSIKHGAHISADDGQVIICPVINGDTVKL